MRFLSTALLWISAISTTVLGQTKEPSIYFENVSKDVGTVTQGEVIKEVFEFANKGSDTLEVLDVIQS